jgi:hypothetical protein
VVDCNTFTNVHYMKKDIVNLEDFATEIGNKGKIDDFEI